jgi:hypothetical protein
VIGRSRVPAPPAKTSAFMARSVGAAAGSAIVDYGESSYAL